MITFPHCKINLGLHITSKRPDGYHNLETLFYPVPLTDALEVIKQENPSGNKVSLTLEGLSIQGHISENLITKAYHLLDKKYNLDPVSFCLLKKIPMGAGLGGGSSDGAFALRLLSSMFNLETGHNELADLAAQLGSDCAFFIQDKPAIGTGRGEILEPSDSLLKGYHLVLVKPDLHISTARAFAGIKPVSATQRGYTVKEITETLPVYEWKNVLFNDFEQSLFPEFNNLKVIKEKLYANGAVYASLSGSGSTVFGLFKNEVDLRNQFEENFYYACILS